MSNCPSLAARHRGGFDGDGLRVPGGRPHLPELLYISTNTNPNQNSKRIVFRTWENHRNSSGKINRQD